MISFGGLLEECLPCSQLAGGKNGFVEGKCFMKRSFFQDHLFHSLPACFCLLDIIYSFGNKDGSMGRFLVERLGGDARHNYIFVSVYLCISVFVQQYSVSETDVRNLQLPARPPPPTLTQNTNSQIQIEKLYWKDVRNFPPSLHCSIIFTNAIGTVYFCKSETDKKFH